MGQAVKRGELYRLRHPAGDSKRARVFVVVSRPGFITAPMSSVICAPIYSQPRGVATEVPVGLAEGLKHESVVLCDLLDSVPRSLLTDYVGMLSAAKLVELRSALRIALAVE